jgi:hypothetical protein
MLFDSVPFQKNAAVPECPLVKPHVSKLAWRLGKCYMQGIRNKAAGEFGGNKKKCISIVERIKH